MAAIMDLFAAEFDDFAKDCDKNYLRASFDDGRYPPRIQVTQTLPPLYAQAEEGQAGKIRETRITVVGDVDCNVSIHGEATMTKKDLNNLIAKAVKLLQLYLHGFMQERKELEAENAR